MEDRIGSSSFAFEATGADDVLVIELIGAFDTQAGAVFEAEILPLLEGWTTVTFDLHRLDSFDAEGMYCLLVARDALTGRGGRMRLRGGRGVVPQWGTMGELFEIQDVPDEEGPTAAEGG